MPRLFPVAVLLLCLLLTACSGDDSVGEVATEGGTTAPTPTPARAAPPPPAPRKGACYRLTYRAAGQTSSSARPVPCRQEHTAVTMHVGRIDTVEDGHLLALDSDHVAPRLAEQCSRRMAAFLGGDRDDRRLSRFQAVWFAPTLEEAQQGADWFRCDLVALAGRDRLLPLPRPARGALDREGTLDRYGTCATAAPGSDRSVRVACARPHAWRAVSTIDLPRGARYLGRRVGERADEQCRDIAAETADALRFSWSFEWPAREDWRDGRRWGTCWLPVGR